MTTNGEKITLLAEIIRVSSKGATEAEISVELSLSAAQAEAYLGFLKARKMIVLLDHIDHFPSEKGLAYLALYGAAGLVDVDSLREFYSKSQGPNDGAYRNKAELALRMRYHRKLVPLSLSHAFRPPFLSPPASLLPPSAPSRGTARTGRGGR